MTLLLSIKTTEKIQLINFAYHTDYKNKIRNSQRAFFIHCYLFLFKYHVTLKVSHGDFPQNTDNRLN